jgi:hypothetical protein
MVLVGVAFFLTSQGLGLAQDSAVLPLIQFNSTIPPARYIHDHTTAQIGALRHQRFHSRGMHTPGLTIADQELKSDFEMETLHRPGSGFYLAWAKAIQADFSYTRMDVYISSQYGEGSCPYRIIRDHENQHVAINTQTLGQYAEQMRQALLACRDFPTRDHPWKVKSQSQARSALKKKVLGLINPIYHRYIDAVVRANARIDTPENYRKTQALCRDW